MKVSIAEVKRRLPEGKEFTAEYVGINRRCCKPGAEVSRRRVIKNKTEIVSLVLDGPNEGKQIHLHWNGLTAEESGGSIVISDNHQGEFLKLTI